MYNTIGLEIIKAENKKEIDILKLIPLYDEYQEDCQITTEIVSVVLCENFEAYLNISNFNGGTYIEYKGDVYWYSELSASLGAGFCNDLINIQDPEHPCAYIEFQILEPVEREEYENNHKDY